MNKKIPKQSDIFFDKKRLEECIASNQIKIPEGLTKKEIIDFINQAAKITLH